MPLPTRSHTTAAASQQARQVRLARARHSLDNTGISLDSSELPSELIADYSIDEVLRLRNVADVGRRQQAEEAQVDEEDDDELAEEDEVDLGKEVSISFHPCPLHKS
jgi:hypothetical protein